MRILSYILIVLFITSCADNSVEESLLKFDPIELNSDFITIATFNIAWLGDSYNDKIERSDKDYRRIASVIRDLEADIIGLQEIENQVAIEKVLQFLPDFKAFIGNSGGSQNTGILYHEGVSIESFYEYHSLAIESGRHRPGFVIYAKKGNFDFVLMDVHFKSTSRYDDTPEKRDSSYLIRSMQAKIASDWADSLIKNTVERDIFILGDMNDNPNDTKNSILDAMKNNSNLIFLTGDLGSCKSSFWSSIDHIVISKEINNRMIPNGIGTYNIYSAYSDTEAEKISDHCPVFAKFDVMSNDND